MNSPMRLATYSLIGMWASIHNNEAWVMFFGAWFGSVLVFLTDQIEETRRRKRGDM